MAVRTKADLPGSLARLGLTRWEDLLLHFPLRYEDETRCWRVADVVAGEFAQVQLTVRRCRVMFRPRRMLVVEAEDDSGLALLRFIHFKDAQRHAFPEGARIRALGEARRTMAGIEFIHPRIRVGWLQPGAGPSTLVPVYPTAAGIAQAFLRRAVLRAIDEAMPDEWLGAEQLREWGLMPLPEAIRQIHLPPADAPHTGLLRQLADRSGMAWNRIRFDELVAQQLSLRRARRLRSRTSARALGKTEISDRLLANLPFTLTSAQHRVWHEVSADLRRSVPMQRLVQGDVGSGKTVIAALAAAQAAGSSCQVAVMAPTEILAQQLHDRLSRMLGPLGVVPALLVGGMPLRDRKAVLEGLSDGRHLLVVGTHALIQKDVAYACLGLAVVDEQHRFGVGQRLALRDRTGETVPHVLTMSATPIPRSLAMTYLADLDVSMIDERPPHRQAVITKLMSSSRREALMARVGDFIDEGGRAYWVCPLIDADDQAGDGPGLSAIETAQRELAPRFGERLLVLHGRLGAEEKRSVMGRFASEPGRLLLATSVIEVGVDVPQATLMVIEHAERFGLAQLHQLRGRIGRGAERSTCILVFGEHLSETARERLKTLYETDDGFEVARRDLAIRGPGEFLGMRQSGVPSLRYSDLERDALWVGRAVAFGAQLADADGEGAMTSVPGVSRAALDALISRWTPGREVLLASG